MATTCLIATVKDEGPWLLEWVAHNLAIGFDHLAIASNDCTDGTNAMLDRLAALGHLIHDENFGPHGNLNIQFSAYTRLRRLPAVSTATWVMALDADEYLNIRLGDGRLPALLGSLPEEAELVPIAWRSFGDSGLAGWVGPELCDTFRLAEAPGRRRAFVKSLIRNHWRVQSYGVHVPRWDPATPSERRPYFRAFTPAGRPIPQTFQDEPFRFRNLAPEYHDWDAAQINHYKLKTREMFALKRLRGDAGGDHRTEWRLDLDAAWAENWNEVEDRSIDRTAPQRKAILAELRADPVLGPLHDRAVEIAKARMEDMAE